MSLLSHIDPEKYQLEFLKQAERNIEALELLSTAKTVRFVEMKPTVEQSRAALAEWWKEWFRLRDVDRKRVRDS